MATRIIGNGLPITKSGNVVTLPCSTKAMEKYAAGHCLVNLTADPDSVQAITAVEGRQEDGSYQVTVADASGWSDGDRVAFSSGETVNSYSTIAAAVTASDSGDDIDLYPNHGETGVYTDAPSPGAKSLRFSALGRIVWNRISDNSNFTFSATDGTTVFEDLHLISRNNGALKTIATAGTPKIVFRRCRIDSYNYFCLNWGTNGLDCSTVMYFLNCVLRKTSALNEPFLYGYQFRVYNCVIECGGGGLFNFNTSSNRVYNSVFNCVGSGVVQANNLHDYNICNIDLSEAHGVVSSMAGAGVLAHRSGGGELGNYRMAEADEVAGTANPNGDEALSSLFTDDVDGRARTRYSIGISEGYKLYAEAAGAPEPPSIRALAPSAGSVAVTVDAAGAEDAVYVRYRVPVPDGSWSAESETLKRTGDGSVTVGGLADGTLYEFAAYAKRTGLSSDWSPPRRAAAGADADALHELRTLLRGEILSDAALLELLGAADAAYWTEPPHPAPYPSIRLELAEREDAGYDEPGVCLLDLAATVSGDDAQANERIVRRLDRLFTARFFTAGRWSVYGLMRLDGKTRAGGARTPQRTRVEERSAAYRLRAFESGA